MLVRSTSMQALLFFSLINHFAVKIEDFCFSCMQGCASSMRSKYYGLLKSMLLKHLQDFNRPFSYAFKIFDFKLLYAFKILTGF